MLFGSHSPLHIITFYIPIQLDCRCNDVKKEGKKKRKKKKEILHKSEHVQKKNKTKQKKTLHIRSAAQPACPVETKSYTSIYSTLLTLPPPSCYWNRQQYLHAARKATRHMDVQGRKVGIAGLTNLDVGIDKHILWMQFKKSCVRFTSSSIYFYYWSSSEYC